MRYVKYDLLSHAFKYVTRSCTLMSCLIATTPLEIVCCSQPSSQTKPNPTTVLDLVLAARIKVWS